LSSASWHPDKILITIRIEIQCFFAAVPEWRVPHLPLVLAQPLIPTCWYTPQLDSNSIKRALPGSVFFDGSTEPIMLLGN
jgi:hypothetical protein